MRRSGLSLVLMLLMILASMAAPAVAGAVLPSAGLYGGLSEPLGGDRATWGVRGHLLFPLGPYLSAGPEVGRFDLDRAGEREGSPAGRNGAWQVTDYGGTARLALPVPGLQPFLSGGLGYYRWREESSGSRRNVWQMSAGGGFDFGSLLLPLRFSVEGRWNGKATTNSTWKGDLNFWSVMAGLRVQL